MSTLGRFTAILFAIWFLLVGIALPTSAVESQVTREIEETDEIDPCPAEEILASPGHHAAPSQSNRGHRRGPRPPPRTQAGAPMHRVHPHPRPGSALPLRC